MSQKIRKAPSDARLVVRVYGLLIDERNRVLAVHEEYAGRKLTKFPGGGLEWGEGTLDCVRREFREETAWEVPFAEHFYTTDFYQASAFREGDQILSVYYIYREVDGQKREPIRAEHGLEFRWLDIDKNLSGFFDLPIDRIVAEKLFISQNPQSV